MELNDKDQERLADKWLDAALKQYGEAAPRTGLEGRVLANLRAESERLAERRDWRHALGAVIAIIVVVAAIFVVRDRNVARQVEAKREAPVMTNASSALGSDRANKREIPRALQQPHRATYASRPMRAVESMGEPRLQQFPSPQPLSKQEEMLTTYVTRFPDEAVAAARAQAEIRKQDELGLQHYLKGSARMETVD
jgi:hypothetical protein